MPSFPEKMVALLSLLLGVTPGVSGLRVPQGQLPEGTVRSGRRLHHTCPCPQDTFPENLVQLRPLLPGVTPCPV